MNELNKLIEQYERENPGNRARLSDPCDGRLNENFAVWMAKLASRPTCGKEQRKFLDEVEKRGKINASKDLGFSDEDTNNIMDMTSFLFQKTFKSDLKKVIKGE